LKSELALKRQENLGFDQMLANVFVGAQFGEFDPPTA
jgi:hypothetical protein